MSTIGLKSISKKISEMEKQIGVSSSSGDFEDIIVNKLENKKKDARKEQISVMKHHYKEGLVSQIDVDNSNNLMDIAYYSVLWIEKNINKLALLLNTDVTSELKLMTCIQLIHEYINDYDDDFLTCTIETLVRIVFHSKEKKPPFPPAPPQSSPPPQPTEEDTIHHIEIPNRKGSVRVKKHLLKNCVGKKQSK